MGNVVLFDSKDKCCACGACMNVCPKGAISMREDEYGFLFPSIDDEKCVECGACKKVCAYQNGVVTNKPLEAYAAVNVNRDQKMKSASGGIFAAMATAVLNEGGVVFGVTLERTDNKFVPHHIGIEKIEDIERLQGSKYVQSSTDYTFKETQKYLKEGKKVLYSGTPCQIAGLLSYLKVDYDNLITVDLICHGVPSAKLFNDFIDSEKNKLKAQAITDYCFRDKLKGWGMNGRLDYIDNSGKKRSQYTPARLASYNTLFLDGLIYRENCYSCKYACENRPGDFTIGDFWGIEIEHPELLKKTNYVEKDGISCIIVNTKKGSDTIEILKDSVIEIRNSSFEHVAKKNGQLNTPSHRSEKRDIIMELYKNKGYVGVEERYRMAYKKQRCLHWVFNKMPRNVRKIAKLLMAR